MNTSQSSPEACVLETCFVWGSTIQQAMTKALEMKKYGWDIQGNPAPMIYNGHYGTGVSITRIAYV